MSPAYTHNLHPTSTLNTAQHQSQCVAAQPHTVTQPLLPISHSVATLSHSHQPTPATYPWLLESSGTQPQRIQYVGPPVPMPGGHSVHYPLDTQDPFTFLSQPQGPSTSHTPARTLIEMHPPLPTPIIQLQPPLQPHLIECGRPICTPIVQTSSFACNVTSTTADATPHTVSIPNYTASPPVTATVTQTPKVCSQTAPVTSITPTSVPLSTNTANTSTVTSQVATPTFPPVVVKQLTQPKPFNGLTPWKTYKEYYERVCVVNGWSTQQEKAQNLMLALEVPQLRF